MDDNPVAAYYNEVYRHTHLDADETGWDFSKIASLWPHFDQPLTIADIGCGAGAITGELVRRGNRVVGVDIMKDALERAAARGLEPLFHDLNSLPLPLEAGTFDAVVALDVLEHVFDPLALLLDLRRLLRPTGFLITFIPNHFDLLERVDLMRGRGIVHREHLKLDPTITPERYFHIRFFTIAEARRLVERSGFRIQAARVTHFEFHPLLRNRFGAWLTSHFPQAFGSGIMMRALPEPAE